LEFGPGEEVVGTALFGGERGVQLEFGSGILGWITDFEYEEITFGE
jgi:hypothetical protein